jgi:soluble lytic murein transglycosylase
MHLAWKMGRAEQQARIAWRLRQAMHGRSAKLDRALDICAYPTPFTRDVVEAATREGIPTGLLYALMRRESFFDPAVVSLAGAYGLLQLMPATAARMASELNDPPPEPDELRQPLLNLRYGAHYLRKLLDETGGNPYTALASYNAGEANGARWWARLRDGEPPETFLLLISYSETRAYVYHVLRYWSVYGETHPLLGHPEARQSR